MQAMWKRILLAVFMCAGAQVFACEEYGLPNTTLAGTVKIYTFFGPPGYGESPSTDMKEQQAILQLTKPLCTVASKDDADEYDQLNVMLVRMGNFDLRPFAGKFVTVRGSLFHANTGHHRTPVLISIYDAPIVRQSPSNR
jgi:hypothetical protein